MASPPNLHWQALTHIGPQRCAEVSGLSDLRVDRIEDGDRHPAPVRVPVLSNEVSVFDATGSPTLQRQDGCVQLLDPVQVPLLVDLLLYARVEVHHRDSDPREGQSAQTSSAGRVVIGP